MSETSLAARADRLRDAFQRAFGAAPELIARAPGRVNLIGEHTDYNDGFVLPMAIEQCVLVAFGRRNDGAVRIYSVNFGARSEFSLDSIGRDTSNTWSNYPRGVVKMLLAAGHHLGGMNLALEGNVPVGSGLSSSAAIEVATAFAIVNAFGIDVPGPQLALLCQRAENEFVGVNCGIMDQFISALGQAGHALLVDCRSLDYQRVPLGDDSVRVVICDTGVRRGLASSEYNQRRSQCEEGVRILSRFLPGIRALRDVTVQQFNEYAATLPEVVQRRCRHVVEENDRTLRAVATLEAGDLAKFGALMDASHASLRDLYEVSSAELDMMVEAARNVPGTLGARMTGAGFGGCTVSLVRTHAVEEFAHRVPEIYARSSHYTPAVYVSQPQDGATLL